MGYGRSCAEFCRTRLLVWWLWNTVTGWRAVGLSTSKPRCLRKAAGSSSPTRGESADDLVRDMIEVLTSMCARLYGRGGARNRAMRAVTAAKQTEAAGAVAGG